MMQNVENCCIDGLEQNRDNSIEINDWYGPATIKSQNIIRWLYWLNLSEQVCHITD